MGKSRFYSKNERNLIKPQLFHFIFQVIDIVWSLQTIYLIETSTCIEKACAYTQAFTVIYKEH